MARRIQQRARFSLSYERRVFINCPFDSDFEELLRAITFSVADCLFEPVCAKMATDPNGRLALINRLVADSRLSIHDLSRSEYEARHSNPRFNMPFELGLVVGHIHCAGTANNKNLLILERKPYRTQRVLSDVNLHDASCHKGNVRGTVTNVREFLHTEASHPVPMAREIETRFRRFERWLTNELKSRQEKRESISWKDYRDVALKWQERNPSRLPLQETIE